jgi:hypothetical protein
VRLEPRRTQKNIYYGSIGLEAQVGIGQVPRTDQPIIYGHVIILIHGWEKSLPGELEIKREIIDILVDKRCRFISSLL